MEKFDLCVIGAGPAGYAAAMRAIDFKKTVLLLEKDKIGGCGIYDGALSSKAMWELSKKINSIRKEITHLSEHASSMSYENVLKAIDEATEERGYQLESHLRLLQVGEDESLLSYVRGNARLVSEHEVITTNHRGDRKIWAEKIIICSGSRPRTLPNIPIDEQTILTSNGIKNLNDFPKSMVILGAGVIGCEYATMFANFGRTKVYLIDKANQILPFEDDDVVKVIASNMQKNGITIHGESQLTRMEIVDGEVEYELFHTDGSKEIIKVEKAMISIGRVPNTETLGLRDVGVKINDHGFIEENETQTTVPNIYAAGDVTGHKLLANVGEMQARYAVEKMFGSPEKPISYNHVSSIMFLNPIIAGVGINEKTARKNNIPYRAVKIDYSCIVRAIAKRNTQGFFKILVTDDEDMRILGMRALGQHASSAIQAVALLISTGQSIRELSELIHPHPSIIEGIQECVRMLLGKSVLKPYVFKDQLKCYRYSEGTFHSLERLNSCA